MVGTSNPPKSRKLKQDDSVIATNNNSIVSKRSVERLYYPEPHFYRYFVKKPLRRSPLINRGYWLRMHAIEKVINSFLDEPSDRQKTVLNLGCGYDPSAFQWLSNNALRRRKHKFIDVDFPDLMAKKREIIVNTPQLFGLLGPYQTPEVYSGAQLRSEHYVALGCNLTDIARVDELLAEEINFPESLILCTAEVSITYMNVEAANALIQWAAQYHQMRFCLLEQQLPDGVEHPFAQKMIEHFNNLNTPLKSVHKYPKLPDQELRFRQRGWSFATARSLWDLWTDPLFVSPECRTALDLVEPFDEWEEFALFSSHYFLLLAANSTTSSNYFLHSPSSQQLKQPSELMEQQGTVITVAHSSTTSKASGRRFGAVLSISSEVFGHHGGLGSKSRMSTMDVYGHAGAGGPAVIDSLGMEARMCHSITSVDRDSSLLVGGRTSPDKALKDCWLLRKRWGRVDNLPMPLYRHCATQVDVGLASQEHTAVVIYGGKTNDGKVSNSWMLWREGNGWIQLNATGHSLTARFGSAMVSTGPGVGILLGGMNSDGLIMSELWEWSIFGSEKDLRINLRPVEVLAMVTPLVRSDSGHSQPLDDGGKFSASGIVGRLGACLVNSPLGTLLIGGITDHKPAQNPDFIKLTREVNNENGKSIWHCAIVDVKLDNPRPLLVGHSSLVFRNNVVIIGGGAVCFSFGTYWNPCLITLSIDEGQQCSVIPLAVSGAEQLPHHETRKQVSLEVTSAATTSSLVRSEIIGSAQDFNFLVSQGRPAVFRNNQLGSCTHWTADGLKKKIGADRAVVVHEAFDSHMDFQQKNFNYVRKPFKDFLDEISGGSRQYLRSLASDDPSKKPADFWADFPELGPDFNLPSHYDTVKANKHSSVLRISGPVSMWLHYDVMANVLCQIRGNKRLILYPPSDVSLFFIPPGTSSSSINCFDPCTHEGHPLSSAHPQEALIGPGDIIFIPPLWLHTASPIDAVSISINVFFHSFDHGYAHGRDVYGNRDLQAYEKGRKDIDKIVRSFDHLPRDAGRFYLERLADELRAKALR